MMADADKRDRPLVLILDGLDQVMETMHALLRLGPNNNSCMK